MGGKYYNIFKIFNGKLYLSLLTNGNKYFKKGNPQVIIISIGIDIVIFYDWDGKWFMDGHKLRVMIDYYQ